MVSVVVPLYNEEETVQALVQAVTRALDQVDHWELLLVDDGSRDATVRVAQEIVGGDPRVRLICLARNYGQSTAMQAGFDHADGTIVVSMDGDLQNDPCDIPRLLWKLEEGYDLVTGYRERRQDKLLTRKVPSWVANRLIRLITGVQIRDNGCSLKAYRREVLEQLRLYSEFHRFIPAISAATSGARITEIPVRHHARQFGKSKYGLGRIPRVAGDLLTVIMIRMFRERPLALFGVIAAFVFLCGVPFAVGPLLHLALVPTAELNLIVLPGVGMLCFWLAGYFVMLGLVAEAALREQVRHGSVHLPIIREVRL